MKFLQTPSWYYFFKIYPSYFLLFTLRTKIGIDASFVFVNQDEVLKMLYKRTKNLSQKNYIFMNGVILVETQI